MRAWTWLAAGLLVLPTCASQALHFYALGDTGCDCPLQHTIGRTMGHLSTQDPVDFVCLLGDVFYHTKYGFGGIQTDAEDRRFDLTFEHVYHAPSLKNVTWFLMLGNHDYDGNVTAWVERQQYSSRWYFPHTYYTRTYRIPNSTATVQLVVVDTALLLVPVNFGKPHGLLGSPAAPQGQDYKSMAQAHLAWIVRTLAESKADWIVAMGHHHIWAGGQYDALPLLSETLSPLFEKAGVVAWFNGHDHSMQHLIVKNVNFFVSGNGGLDVCSNAYARVPPPGASRFYRCNGGFADVEISPTEFSMQFRNPDGHSVYSYKTGNPRVALGLVPPPSDQEAQESQAEVNQTAASADGRPQHRHRHHRR